ncbi:MAG: AbrB/MazE/SpoVT family DNA-binding domain-containing protein [Deltaproteobacteria bacterium]|nr:AbrB/MazE/SpoVT family DNA-binding domain-containing protein [Deltaproteobacteria bacterium]
MRGATRLTTKGQVVIPKAIRDRLRWRAGTLLDVEAEPDGTVRMRAAALDAIDRGFGFLTEGDPVGDLEAEHRAEIAEDERDEHRRR